MRRLLIFMALLVVVGCAKPAPAPAPEPPPPARETPPVEEGGIPSAALFPTQDRDLQLWVWDMGAPQAGTQAEQRLREGDRVIVVQNGRPAFTWLLDDTGVWREDPGGGGLLLRYLPPTLKESVWQQRSGDATVWFSLRSSPNCQECWQLNVLNRGVETMYLLAPDNGPKSVRAVSTDKPGSSFLMTQIQFTREERLPAEQRTAALEKAAPRSTVRADVVAATAADYDAARTAALRLESRQADLDGDGRPEQLRGRFSDWSLAPVEVLAANGSTVGELLPANWAQRVEIVPFGKQHIFVVWQRGPGGETSVGLEFPQISNGRWGWTSVYGWGVKHAVTTPATRARWDESGLLTVEWDMGNPAGHTRIRQYRVNGEVPNRSVSLEKEEFRPQGGALRYPADAKGVLEAAWTVQWYGIPNELRMYFANDTAAEAFRAGIRTVGYGGGITLGAPGQVPSGCPYKFTAGEPGPDGTATWLTGYPGLWYDEVWGTVRFTRASDGRLLIESFAVVDQHACQP